MANIIIDLNADNEQSKNLGRKFTFKDIAMPLTSTYDANFDLNAIRQSIQNIFSWKQGERILDPLFGNVLEQFVYEPINSLSNDNMKLAIERMLKYEPRMIVTAIDITSSDDETDRNELNVAITYDIPQLSIRGVNDNILIS